MTREQLLARRAELVAANEAAAGWGAAVGARSEQIADIDRQLAAMADGAAAGRRSAVREWDESIELHALGLLVQKHTGCMNEQANNAAAEISRYVAMRATRTSIPAIAEVEKAWRPIETAPQSKTILLFAVSDIAPDGDIRNWRMATGFYNGGADCWVWDGNQIRIYDLHPTHWMPLPAPPASLRGRA